jgi:hypothetical protein
MIPWGFVDRMGRSISPGSRVKCPVFPSGTVEGTIVLHERAPHDFILAVRAPSGLFALKARMCEKIG